jgi:GTP-binding protein
LGYEFLRHVERTRVLVHPSPAWSTVAIRRELSRVRNELRQYDVDLADRPELLAVSKGELPAPRVRERLAEETGGEVAVRR